MLAAVTPAARPAPPSPAMIPDPFRPADEKINQGAQNVGEYNYEDPNDFVIIITGLIGGAIHNHPNPENG